MWSSRLPESGGGALQASAGLCPLSLGAGEAGAAPPSLLLGLEPLTVSPAPPEIQQDAEELFNLTFQGTTERRRSRHRTGAVAPLSPASGTPAVKLEQEGRRRAGSWLLSPVFRDIRHHPSGITCCRWLAVQAGSQRRAEKQARRGRCHGKTGPHH